MNNDRLNTGKTNLLVSVSGGESSLYMAQWLWKNKRNDYNFVFVFANTGQENEETLVFVDMCEKHFGFKVIWIEALVNTSFGVGNSYKVTNFKKADRDGRVFEEMIKKHGIPNMALPFCSKELKAVPISKFGNDYFKGEKYNLAIGIREDEADRISKDKKKRRIIYPLIDSKMRPMTKPKINFWWSMQPFRLNLKGYEGNCKTCWKKSDKKLWKIAKDNPEKFDFMKKMEEKYSLYVPPGREIAKKAKEKGIKILDHNFFFRRKRSARDILDESKNFKGVVADDSIVYSYQKKIDFDGTAFNENEIEEIGSESCEVFSSCESEEYRLKENGFIDAEDKEENR